MSTGYVALSAVFYGLIGPFVKIMATDPITGALLASLASGAVHGTTSVANLARCTDVRAAPVWAVLGSGWLFAVTRVALFVAYVLLPVSIALPLFFIWVPLAAVADWFMSTRGSHSYRGSAHTGSELAMRAVLALCGAVLLVLSDRWDVRSRSVILGLFLVIVAAAANAARVIVTKYHLMTLNPTDRVASANWLLAVVAGVSFLRRPDVLATLGVNQFLGWTAFGLGVFIAHANVVNELESLSVTDTSFTLLLELLVAVIAGLVFLGEYRQSQTVMIGTVAVPLSKLLGLAAIATASV